MDGGQNIAVTGLGLATPIGLSAAEAWERCAKGQSGIAICRHFQAEGHACHSAAAVSPYELGGLRIPKNEKFMNPGARHLIHAAQQALANAGLPVAGLPVVGLPVAGLPAAGLSIGSIDPARIAVYAGSGHAGPEPREFFRAFDVAQKSDGRGDWEQAGGRAMRLIDPYFPLRTLANSGVALLAMETGARGPSGNFVPSGVASALALDAACRDLREGRCDVALAGGFDFLLHRASYLAFEKQGWLSGRPPDEALRPFDRDADGLILGEGAAVAVLERASDARDRGVPVLAEIDGFGSAAGGADANGPFAAFSGLAAAVAAAKISGTPDFIVASGFGLPAADRAEAAVLSAVFGNNIPVTAFKGLTGYLGAATGLVEIVLGILALRNRLIPAVAHFGTAAEDVDLNIVSSQARPLPPMRPVSALFLSASWFGASAAVLVRHSGR